MSIKTINNIITVKEQVDKIKGELKKDDLSRSRKYKLESKLHKQKNNLSSLLKTQIKINHTNTIKIVKTINNIITVEKPIDKIKGELKKNDLSTSKKNKLESKLLKQKNNLSSLLKTQIIHTNSIKIVKTINNIITVEKLIDKIKGELRKNDLSRSKKNKLESKLLKQENNLKALNKTLNYLSSLVKTQIKINHTDTNENNPFDFSDIKTDNDEIDLGEYLNIIENNIVKFENDDISKVLKNVTDEYPFILKGELKINDKEPSMINAFFSNRDALIERIEKIKERYDESIPITFTGIVIKYTKSFNKIRRSYYGTGCDSFKKRLLNIEVFYVISLKKMNVSENVLNSYTKKISLKNIMIL